MKIKRLTIHGFKSFVDKVSLNFSVGTSAVIGPNGCGKSNIVDSIRWVLGEQNARHLRGKHMEDVIFNGSDSRKPLGMAEVVLTFSNDSGTAPSKFVGFTEIEIARRLYRSGESEYYINKVPSRLRDIVDLFTDTGIGSRAYSIIEQGQVGWLINAKPEERRVIFEEAAGINKFKHKKEAALRRLEATKENLTRVSDIISEVKRQLNSLNRQAKKAERYKALRDEFQAVDLRLSTLEFRRMKEGLDDLVRRLEEIKDQEIAFSNRITAQEAMADSVKVEHIEAENAFRAVRDKVFELEKLIGNEERASELAHVRIDELTRTEERLTEEIEDLKKSKADSIELIDHLRGSLTDLASMIAGESGKLNENTRLLEALVAELKSKEESERTEKAETLKAVTRLTDIRHSIQTLLRDSENLRVREARAASEKEEVLRAIAAKEDPLRAVRAYIGSSAEKKSSIEAELKSIRERLEALESSRAASVEAFNGLKDEYSRASAMLTTLEEMEKNFENIKGGAKAIMLKGERGGVHGLIADVIEANPGYEKAVEAVMGDRLQYIIVESQRAGVEAIEYLKANSGGRGSFIPVKDLRASANPVAVAGGMRFSGAKELISEIRIKDGYETIVNYLIGDTLIVDDLAAALDVWKEQGAYKTIVTLDGDVIDPQGIITGGAASGSESGILQKKNEIKKIRTRVAELQGKLSAVEAEVKETEEGLRSTKAAIEDCRDRLHAADIEKVNLESELKRHEEEFARLARTRDTLASDIVEAAKRLSEISVRKDSLSSEREALEKSVSEREGRSRALAGEISGLAAKKEALNQVVTEIRVTLAQTKERHGSLAKQVAEKERSIEETDRRLELKKAEIERGRKESAEKTEQVNSVKERLERLLGETEGVKRLEVEKTELLTELSEKIKGIEAEFKELKSAYSESQELKGELTIELKETELSIGNLKEKILEKYSTDISTYRNETSENEAGPDISSLEARKNDLREKIASLGEVSLSALEEYADLERRHQFLIDQQTDLNSSVEALMSAITRINRTTREKFKTTFEEINNKFQETFPRFFAGGKAELRLTDDGDILDAGVEIAAQPPGKRLQNITLLSGGEKALTATALIFAIFLIKPSPFCLLDEVDAPLDEANIDRFNSFVHDMARLSQFMLITHNKKTMEMADTLYGITMEEPGVSKVISVKF
ncbi:MAG: chromosome segregation protein SMC [Deltaproteobacteria bacterium]|nr:chromosome segregation protein SMC [Deltaproteobacteria bacterium]